MQANAIPMATLIATLSRDAWLVLHPLARPAKSRMSPTYSSRTADCSIEFPVCLQVEISLHVADGKDIPDLRAYSENARSEAAEKRTSAGVVRDLLVGVSEEAHEGLFRKKLSRAPVEMEIDFTLNLRIRV